MDPNKAKQIKRDRRKRRVRKSVFGTTARPRLTVTRSLKNISAQIIDDERGVTLVQAATLNKDLRGTLTSGGNVAAAKAVGAILADRALAKQIAAVAFDRNGYRYHGRIKALADAARERGLKF